MNRQPRQRRRDWGWLLRFLLVGLLLTSLPCVRIYAEDILPIFRPNDALTRSGLQHFYNLDFDRAIADLEKASGSRPNGLDSRDSYALNNLANCYIVRELYRTGALDPADYVDDKFIKTRKRPAAAGTLQRITAILDRADALEAAGLSAKPDDAEMLYARGVTRALRASYSGWIEHSWFAALRSAVAARQDHQRVLKLSPAFTDADLIVGTHDYVMASLPWAVKATAAMVGFRGNRQRGIEELRRAVAGGGPASIDARILLALFLRREGQLDEALRLVRGLVLQFPGNVLFCKQEADILFAAHRNPEALSAYQRVWAAGRAGRFPVGGYQSVAVHMGDLQRSLQKDTDALTSYALLEGDSAAPPELRQRALFSAAQIYDSLGKNSRACEKYRAIVAIDRSSAWAQQTRATLKCVTDPSHREQGSVAQGQ